MTAKKITDIKLPVPITDAKTMLSYLNFTQITGVMAEALRANIGSKLAISLQRGPVNPKFQVGVAPTNHSSSQKTRIFLPFCYNLRI